MRILFVSGHPSGVTAYCQQTRYFTRKLRDAGHQVAIFAIDGTSAVPTRFRVSLNDDGILILPKVAHRYGDDIIHGHVRYTKSDLVITLADPHVFNPNVYGKLPCRFGWCAWAPIDCAPPYPKTIVSLRAAQHVWSPSRFGVEVLEDTGIDAEYVPHGISSTDFFVSTKKDAREKFATVLPSSRVLDEKFLIAIVAANRENPARKGFEEAFEAVSIFSKKHSILLYVHSIANGTSFGGVDLSELVRKYGIGEITTFAPQYNLMTGLLDVDFMRNLYNAADVVISASHGEGFGLSLVEAQFCGTPVVAPDNTSHPEVCFGAVWARSTRYECVVGDAKVGRFRPSVADLADGLEKCLDEASRNMIDRNRLRETALHYELDHVFDKYFVPALKKIENVSDGA